MLIDAIAAEADGIVIVNRIKPHTEFTGPIESGWLKMLTIGLGKHQGALAAHRHAVPLPTDGHRPVARELIAGRRCSSVWASWKTPTTRPPSS